MREKTKCATKYEKLESRWWSSKALSSSPKAGFRASNGEGRETASFILRGPQVSEKAGRSGAGGKSQREPRRKAAHLTKSPPKNSPNPAFCPADNCSSLSLAGNWGFSLWKSLCTWRNQVPNCKQRAQVKFYILTTRSPAFPQFSSSNVSSQAFIFRAGAWSSLETQPSLQERPEDTSVAFCSSPQETAQPSHTRRKVTGYRFHLQAQTPQAAFKYPSSKHEETAKDDHSLGKTSNERRGNSKNAGIF